jgi:carbohydrate diacid regulator
MALSERQDWRTIIEQPGWRQSWSSQSRSSTGFQQVASAVVHRAAAIIERRVLVADEHGTIIASSVPVAAGLTVDQLAGDDSSTWNRMPFCVEGVAGELVVANEGAETVSPRVLHALVDLMVSQITVVERLPHQHELKDRFIVDLLHHPAANSESLSREANVLGIDLSAPRAVLVIDAAEYILRVDSDLGRMSNGEIRRRAQHVISGVVRYFKLPDAAICAYLGDGEVAVLKASNSQNLQTWLDPLHDDSESGASWANLTALKRAAQGLLDALRAETQTSVNVGVGRYHPGIRGLASSYDDARVALSLGARVGGQNLVHCLDGLGLAAFVGVADERMKVDLARYLLSPLDHEPELLETIETFFREDCCPSSTAKQLSIHRNTLGHRLNKVKALTGLDPRHFDDAVQIRLACVLRVLEGDSRVGQMPMNPTSFRGRIGQSSNASAVPSS